MHKPPQHLYPCLHSPVLCFLWLNSSFSQIISMFDLDDGERHSNHLYSRVLKSLFHSLQLHIQPSPLPFKRLFCSPPLFSPFPLPVYFTTYLCLSVRNHIDLLLHFFVFLLFPFPYQLPLMKIIHMYKISYGQGIFLATACHLSE